MCDALPARIICRAAQQVACLRALSTQQLLDLQGSPSQILSSPAALLAFFPNVDGRVIPLQPEIAIALGQFNKVPVIQGTNLEEGNLFIALAFDILRGTPLAASEYPGQVRVGAQTILDGLSAMFGGTTSPAAVNLLTQEILNEYPLRDFQTPGQALAAVTTDGTFSCPALVADELLSLQVPTFAYEFADRDAPMLFLPPVSFPFDATHTDELQYLFTNLSGVPSQLNGNQTRLASTMKDYWSQFADHGSPNSVFSSSPGWPAFTILAPATQSLVAPRPRPQLDFSAEHHCLFWSGLLLQGVVTTVISAAGG